MQKMIFIVDDNDANLTMAASALEDMYRVLTIPSAEKMFLLLGKKKPDLILLDIEMPEMGGFEAISVLKENPELKDIPVVFITGWTNEKLVSDAFQAGVLDVVKKPITPPELQDCVKKIFGQQGRI